MEAESIDYKSVLFCYTKGVRAIRIPTDISLERYIKQLIAEDKLYKFYKTKDWLELRDRVMEDNNYECQRCLKKGKYTKAERVHHVNEVRTRPDLALSRTYRDQDGVHENLMPLCLACHVEIHEEMGTYGKKEKKEKFTNVERW